MKAGVIEQINVFSTLFNSFFIKKFSCTARFFILICVEATMWSIWVKVGLEELDALQALMENSPWSFSKRSQGNLYTINNYFQECGKAGESLSELANWKLSFLKEGKGLLSRLVFRKAPVSKSQENIMCPKVNTQKPVFSSESNLGTTGHTTIFSWYFHRCNWIDMVQFTRVEKPAAFKKLEMYSLSNAGLSLQLEDLGSGGISRSLGLQQGNLHVFSLGDLIQAGTPRLTAKSQMVFIFTYLFFPATRYKLGCLVRKTCLIVLCINFYLERKCFSNKLL